MWRRVSDGPDIDDERGSHDGDTTADDRHHSPIRGDISR